MTPTRHGLPFLKAAWTDLIIASYAVPDAWVSPRLPPGVEIDRWEGSAYVSLVAFDFRRARILGLTSPFPPGLCTFPEVNLRTYGRQGDRRGVVFLGELVPNPFVAFMANAAYNEHYITARMTSRVTRVGDIRRIRHDFAIGSRRYTIAATGRGGNVTTEDDVETFFKERGWGFGAGRGRVRTISYAVAHPAWRTYPVEDLIIDVDFGTLYGAPWDALTGRPPDHVLIAEGSDVAVYPWRFV